MFLGTHRPFLESAHQAEERHLQWAPAMEAVMRERFSTAALSRTGLAGLKLTALDCRTSMCRIDVEYPAALEEKYPEPESHYDDGRTELFGASGPLQRLFTQTGPLASTVAIVRGRDAPTSDVRTSGVMVVFSEDEIDPNRYFRWVAAVPN